QIRADLADAASDPRALASDEWYRAAFEGQAYGKPVDGTSEDIARLGPDDIRAFHARTFDRSRLTIAAAGAISPDKLPDTIDRIFGDLPGGDTISPTAARLRAGPFSMTLDRDVAGACIVFGLTAPPPGHADFAAARVVAHVLGSGNFDSRLFDELRIKSG